MRSLIVVALVGACTKEPGEGFPIQPGGGGGTGSSFLHDAAVPDPDGAPPIAGRVCLLSDARAPTTCAAAGAAGLTVGLGTSSATTADDGTFTLTPPSSTMDLYWSVTGAGMVPSAQRFTAGGPLLPVIGEALYTDMVATTQAIDSDGAGAILMRITRVGAPVVGATVAALPVPESSTYYDGDLATQWEEGATAASGVTWISSISPGDVTLTISSNAMDSQVTTKTFADTLTFVFAEIP
jgi:hypothetical protein